MNKYLAVILAVTSLLAGNAMAQQDNLPKYGNDSIECVKNLSLFNEYFKQNSYEDALDPWHWVFKNCPASSKKIYVNGAAMYESKIALEKNPAVKSKLADTLLLILDQRIRYFGEEGFVTGRKGLALFDYTDRKEEALELLKKSVDMEGNKTGPILLYKYFQLTTDLYSKNKVTKEQVLDLYDQLGEIIEFNLENGSKDSADYDKSRINIENFFGPFANCDDLISIYTPRIKANTDDVRLMRKVVYLFEKKKCSESQAYLDAAEKLYKLEPSAGSAASLARLYSAKGNYAKASGLYNEAIDLDSSINKKALYNLELAEINLQKLKNYPQARVYAQRAAALRPAWGRPLLFIGDIYVASASSCSDDAFKRSAVFWAAIDKYQRAKALDPTVAEDANRLAATYSKYYPSKEDVFFNGLKDGDSFTIDYCWINETTTVRIR